MLNRGKIIPTVPPHPLKRDELISELPYLRSSVLPPPPPPPFPRPPSGGPHANGAPRSPNDAPPPVPARPTALGSRPKTSPGVSQEQIHQIPPHPPRILATAQETHPHLDIAGPNDHVRQRVYSRALPHPAGVTNAHTPALPPKVFDGWNPSSYGGMVQQIVGANFRVPVENEAAVRMKEEMLARQRAIEEDRLRMQAIAAEERRLEERRHEERRHEEEAARERKRRQEEEARLAREREAERLRLEAEEAERLRLAAEAEREKEAKRRAEEEANRRAEEEANRRRLEQERREQWEREEAERQQRWERDEAERIRWLLNEKQTMEDEGLARMEAMKEEMRIQLRNQKAELEAAAAAAQLEAEEAAKKRERELQEQRDAELAKLIAEETQDMSPPPTPPPPQAPVQAIDGGPVQADDRGTAQANASLPSYEELSSGQLSPPAPLPNRHSPSPRSRPEPLPPTPPMFPTQLPYHEQFQLQSMGNPPGPNHNERARTPVRGSPMRTPVELPPENPVFQTVSPPVNGHVHHGSESFDHIHAQHRPPVSNPGLSRQAVSLGGANPGRAPPPRVGGFNPHQPHASPPRPAPHHLNPDEGLPVGARSGMVPGGQRPNVPGPSAGPSQPLYPSALQASGSGPVPGPVPVPSGSRAAHYGDPPPDGVSGICERALYTYSCTTYLLSSVWLWPSGHSGPSAPSTSSSS